MPKLTTTNMQYENRVVFFFDILGFKDLIHTELEKNSNSAQKIFKVFEFIKNFYKDDVITQYATSKQITFFSDCVVISFLEEEATELPHTIFNLQILLVNLLKMGIVIRGGIAKGKLFHSNDYIFGPAFIDAYNLESINAKFPRIICNASIIALILKGKTIREAEQDFNVFTSIVKKDDDGFWYIDYIENINSLFNSNIEYLDYCLVMQNTIKSKLALATCEKVKAKYIWMKNKYNKRLKTIIINNNSVNIDEEILVQIKQLELIK